MEQTVYTYGGGEAFYYIFNAVAVLVGAGAKGGFLGEIAVVLGVLGAIVVSAFRNDILYSIKWFAWYSTALIVLFMPKTTVWVNDTVTHNIHKIDNVPWVLGVFAGKVSTFSHGLTKQFEQVFSLPNNLKYHETGSLFASRMIEESNDIKITDADLKESFHNFTQQCIFYDLALGNKYSLEELRTTDNIWGLVKDKASPARSFVYRDKANKKSNIVSCQEGANKLEHEWDGIVNKVATAWGMKKYGSSQPDSAKINLLSHLQISYGYLADFAGSAQDIIQQKVMINVLRHGFLDGAAKVDAGTAMQKFAADRAYEQQKSAYLTTGELASKTLVNMKTLFEALIYALFPLVMVLSLMSATGYKTLMTYGGLVLWVNTWPMVYAVLNFIMTLGAKSQSGAIVAEVGGRALSWGASGALSLANEDLVAQAGYLSMSIPFISYAIIKGGAGSFVHLAGHLGSVTQGVSSSAAADTTLGNHNYGNVSTGNVSQGNVNSFKHNTDVVAQGGAVSTRTGKGMTKTEYGDRTAYNAKAGMSQLADDIRGNETMSASVSSQQSALHEKSISSREGYTEGKQYIKDKSEQLAESVNTASQNNESWTKTMDSSTQEAINNMRGYHSGVGTSHSQDDSKQMGVGAEMHAGTPGGKMLGFGASGNVNTNATARQGEQTSDSSQSISNEQYNEALTNFKRWADTHGDQITDSKTKGLVDNLSAKTSEMATYQKSVDQSERAAESLQHFGSLNEQYGNTVSHDFGQTHVDVLELKAKQGEITESQKTEYLESSDPFIRQEGINLTKAEFQGFQEQFLQENADRLGKVNDQNDYYAEMNNSYESFSKKVGKNLQDVDVSRINQERDSMAQSNKAGRFQTREEVTNQAHQIEQQTRQEKQRIIDKNDGLQKEVKDKHDRSLAGQVKDNVGGYASGMIDKAQGVFESDK